MAEVPFKGLIQVYTGDGKGKTTAALGQAVRACGQGLKVIVVQFLKGQAGGEHLFAEKLKQRTDCRGRSGGLAMTNKSGATDDAAILPAGTDRHAALAMTSEREPAGDEAILPFEIIQFGKGDLFKKSEQELLQETKQAYEFAQKALTGGKYDLVVLDEIFIAHWRGLLSLQQVLDLMQLKPDNVELIMTGRKAPQEVVKRADLVTEMLVIKHPLAEGIQQRKGIEY
jgi:cob(I)alamin adenosyltransferase